MIVRILILILLCGCPLFSQTAENVLLVMNEASPLSMEVGLYYSQKRGIPHTNLLRIKTIVDDSISREDFESQIEAPIASWLSGNFAQDRILYIVLTRGIPLRISGTSGKNATTASVDSELALLYRKMVSGKRLPSAGRIENPYFLGNTSLSQAKKFSHEDQDIYLVTRLDGFSDGDIRGLIDRGISPSREGKILLDAKGLSTGKGDSWLQAAADVLTQMGFEDRVTLDSTEKALTGMSQVLGYYSWGSNDPALQMRHFDLEFVPGALAGMFVSSDARTFSEPPPDWNVGSSDDPNARFAGSPQSLSGDLIRAGVTGVAGHVAEPFLEATIRPDILFPAYMSGFNLAESYYLSMPYLSWQTVVVGDPLCGPFRAESLTSEEIDRGLDPDTELPASFGLRRLRSLSVEAYKRSGVHPDTVKLIVQSEARLAKGDREGARESLEAAVSRDSRLPAPQVVLAGLYEAAGEYEKAIPHYRRLLELLPDSPAIMNSLAYALARQNNIGEALPLAERAHKLGKGNPTFSHVLGWIYHLAGQNDRAAQLLEEVVRSAPQNPEAHLHFAIVSAETGNTLAAQVALERALEMEPKLEERPEVRQLREKLK
jgi:uncharacterized protein (TIGR03790 family)